MSNEDQALNTGGEETTDSTAPVEESTTTQDTEGAPTADSTEEQGSEAQGEQQDDSQGKEEKPRRDSNSRIRQLIGEKKQLEQQITQQAQQGGGQVQQQHNQLSQSQQNDFASYVANNYGGDISYDTLNSAMNEYVQQNIIPQVDQRLSQHEAVRQQEQVKERLSQDADSLAKFEELNPDHENYDSDLESEVVDLWKAQAKVVEDRNGNIIWADPNIRLKDVAKREINKIKRYSERGAARGSEVTKKQSAHTAITPSTGGGASKNEGSLSASDIARRHGLKVVDS